MGAGDAQNPAGSSSQHDDTRVALARMQEQMANVVNAVQRIERSVAEVVSIDRNVATLQANVNHQAKEMAAQWQRIDEVVEAADVVDRKLDRWVSFGKGAMWIVAIVGGLVQIALIAGVAWTFNSIQENRSDTIVLKQQILNMEATIRSLR